MTRERLALLYRLRVSLNTSGEIVVDFENPPSSKDIESAFDAWNPEYEHTKKIVSLCEHLRDYSDFQYKEISKLLSF